MPPLPNTEPEAGLAAEPKALVDLDAKPPNADELDAGLLSLVPAEEPKALNAVPELGWDEGVVFAANGEVVDDPKADVLPKAEVDPNAEVEPKPDDEPKAGVDV